MRNMRLFNLILIMLLQSGCTATITNTWNDDYSTINGFKGGVFSYVSSGPFLQARYDDGVEQAKKICDGRMIGFKRLGSETVSSTTLIQVNTTAAGRTGVITNPANPNSFLGPTYSTVLEPVQELTQYANIQFICTDKDIQQHSYALKISDMSAPVCMETTFPYIPGDSRISTLSKLNDSVNCIDKEGWFRYLDGTDGTGREHLFVGTKGKALCFELEEEMVQQQIPSSSANLYLRKRLSCK